MVYPTITETTAQYIIDRILEQPIQERESYDPGAWERVDKPSDVHFDEVQIIRALLKVKNWWASLPITVQKKNQMLLEGKVSAELHAFLNYHDQDFEFVEDPDFWRYLAVFPLRWYLMARHPELTPESFGGVKKADTASTQISRPQFINQLIFRSYLRGQVAFDLHDPNPYERTEVLEINDAAPTDIWQSHLIRTQLGHLGECAHAFIDSAVRCRTNHKHSPLQPARDAAKLLTRAKHNVLFDLRSLDEMRKFVDDVFL